MKHVKAQSPPVRSPLTRLLYRVAKTPALDALCESSGTEDDSQCDQKGKRPLRVHTDSNVRQAEALQSLTGRALRQTCAKQTGSSRDRDR